MAANGTARNAPAILKSEPPTVTEISTTTGCRLTALDCNSGERILPSSCCTRSTMMSVMTASVTPRETRATVTDRAPAMNAPTMGMNPVINVRTASASAKGTPRMIRPDPMKTASTSDTSAWARIKPLRVIQPRVSSSVRCQPARCPTMPRSQGRNLSPSLRKKNVSTSTTSMVTMTELAMPRPENTSDAIEPALDCSHWAAVSMRSSRSLGSRFMGGP